MASSFKGWANSWAQTWERVSNPNAMYGSVTIRFAVSATLTAPPSGFISGSATISFIAVGRIGPDVIQIESGGGGGEESETLRLQVMEEDIILVSLLQTIIEEL